MKNHEGKASELTNNRFLNKLTGLGLATALFLSGCTTPPPEQASREDLSQAAYSVLSTTIAMRNLYEACNNVGGEVADTARSVYQQWLDNNWEMVVGADAFYRAELSDQVIAFDNQTLALPALKLLKEETAAANRKTSFIYRSRTNRAKTCDNKLQEFNAENNYNLPTDNVIHKGFMEYAEHHSDRPAPGERVPTLAGNLSIDSDPGKSLYQIEQSVRDMPCPAPQVFTFKNQWPYEVYAAFCRAEQRLYTCEWGSCSLQ